MFADFCITRPRHSSMSDMSQQSSVGGLSSGSVSMVHNLCDTRLHAEIVHVRCVPWQRVVQLVVRGGVAGRWRQQWWRGRWWWRRRRMEWWLRSSRRPAAGSVRRVGAARPTSCRDAPSETWGNSPWSRRSCVPLLATRTTSTDERSPGTPSVMYTHTSIISSPAKRRGIVIGGICPGAYVAKGGHGCMSCPSP